jgi:hypothetical protein
MKFGQKKCPNFEKPRIRPENTFKSTPVTGMLTTPKK